MNGDLSFWARRKAAVAAEAEAERARALAEVQEDAQAALEERSDEDILTDLGLPDPDSLRQGDDFTAFMTQAVPDRIRRRALRTLWRSNPVLANLDDLVDYGEDYTDSAMVTGPIRTAYSVGKGMLKHIEEMERQARAAETPEAVVAADAPEVEEAFAATDTIPETAPVPTEETPEADEAPAPLPRRMKFRNEEAA